MTMAELVARVLRIPATRMIDFTLHGIPVNGSNFEKVAKALDAGNITAIHDTSAGPDEAYYQSDIDEFQLGFNTLATPLHIGLVVHEAVHAIGDIHSVDIKVRHSEAAAYIAQVLLFYYGHKSTADAHPDENPFGDAILSAAWTVSKPLRNTCGKTLTTAQLKPLDDAIIAHRKYTANKDNKVLNNGV